MTIKTESIFCFGCKSKDPINSIYCINCFLIFNDPIESIVPIRKRIIEYAVNWGDLIQVNSYPGIVIPQELKDKIIKEHMELINEMLLINADDISEMAFMDSVNGN